MPPARPLCKDAAALEARLRAVLPAVRLLTERRLRWVLRAQTDAGLRPPADPRQPVWADRDLLQQLDLAPSGDAARYLLLTPPDDRLLSGCDDSLVLDIYERLLFRGVITDRPVQAEAVWDALSEPVRREARFVLEAEGALPTDPTDADAARAFVPVLLELLAYDPLAVPDFFPLLAASGRDPIDLPFGVDWRQVREQVRLERPAADPATAPADESAEPDAGSAARDGALGNHVRAAILYTKAGQPQRARREIKALLTSVGPVLGWPAGRAEVWTAAVIPLLPAAASGVWTPAARALYDLQRAAAELGRAVYAVDPVGVLTSLGRKPLRRSLAPVTDAILLRHLTKASGHLHRVQLPEAELAPLFTLLAAERYDVEGRVRATIGPRIEAVLTAVGLVPADRAERVARDKVVAELLDALCDRGFLRLADLRDAVARNQLKLPDLAGPRGLVRRDALLRADARLADELYGVYHRGELYLRLIQRLSAAAFGTRVGRFLTKYAALPFGGAFMALEFVKEMTHLSHKAADWAGRFVERFSVPEEEDLYDFSELYAAPPPPPAEIVTWHSVLAVGLVFFLLLHVRPVRHAVGRALSVVGRGLRVVLWDAPRAVWRSPPVRLLVENRAAVFVRRRLLLPAVIAAVIAGPLVLVGYHPRAVLRAFAWVFAVVGVAFNTPVGRRLQDDAAESWADAWRTVTGSLVPGVVGFVIDLFKALAGWFERALYAVDEWFRYREGQTQQSLAAKAALGLLWFPVAYLARFAFYLLFEPQINPLKHFPVVTVSHKMLVPLVPSVAAQLGIGDGTAFLLVACVPGVFGFMAWELMSNWRLYAANRPAGLPPTPLGHHGETMRGLLRPGFHSGTVPKLFRTLRQAHARPTADRKAAVGKAHHELAHLRHALAGLVERELFPLWQSVPGLCANDFAVERVTLGCQRAEVRIAAGCGEPLAVGFENVDGVIVGTVDSPGWTKGLADEPAAAVTTGLAGLFALAAAESDAVPWATWSRFWGREEVL